MPEPQEILHFQQLGLQRAARLPNTFIHIYTKAAEAAPQEVPATTKRIFTVANKTLVFMDNSLTLNADTKTSNH